MFFTVQKSNLGYDKTDNTKMFCLMNASENIAWFYHKNVIIKEYGEFFEMCK
jgi:hypothetical protein